MTTITQLPSAKVPLADDTGLITTQWYRYFFNLYTLTTSGGIVVAVTASSPLLSSGGISPNISIPLATSAQGGYLSATDWVNFNSKQPGGTYVTAVTGTSPVVSSGGTTPAISMPAASTSVSGYLTSTDWNTFNSKGSGTVTSVSGTAPINVATGTTTPVISLASNYGDTQNPYASKTANYVLAAPNGSAGVPTFRALVSGDVTGLGTMATQNANAVAITGGTINGTVIGGTTPAAGTFTTITGQTEVLRGTGQNLFTQSNTFTNATAWTVTGLTVTGGQSDPDGGSNASLLTISAQFQGIRNNGYTLSAGAIYTLNIWCRVASGTRTFSVVDNSSNILGSFTATTSWVKYTVTFTAVASTTLLPIQDRNASGFVNAFVYQSQLEFGSVTGTYIPTTTTAVYGTPTLSFSGVSGLGLQSDGSLYVSPAGTGALQAQATTSSTVGGNARGANAVDWQTTRSNATFVASGANSSILGGQNNTASGANASVAGGATNVASGLASIVAGGGTNTSSGERASILGGQTNTAAGYYNFIGGGFTNSGTANAAVTTQSGTMNGTTAVTLSGSNASIKVGQLITGTSIANYTYVAAISGTSLTLSQAASGSSTSTLSFYTPHGVVVGGGNNTATGSYSFIGGGGDAGTAANRNVASGDWSFVGGGIKNTATGIGAVIAGGGLDGANFFGNIASNVVSTVGGGLSNNASGAGATIIGGYQHAANSNMSSILGGRYGITRGVIGYTVFSACNVPLGSFSGYSQAALLILARQTTDATATVLTSDANAASGTNQVILPNNSAYYFKVRVIAGVTGAGNTKAWTLEGAIKRGAGVGTTAIVGTVTTTIVAADAGASTWTVTATADTTNGGLAITVTGQASTTIRWVAKAETAEMTF
jgi:hypothetical protein